MTSRSTQSRRAFTLLELGAVVVIMGIVAVSVVPAVARMGEARAAAGAFEVARLIEFARADALASGMPCGVRIDAEEDLVELQRVTAAGLVGLPGALGEPEPSIQLRSLFGADVTRVNLSAGPLAGAALDDETIWFAHDGSPHLRTRDGVLVGPLATDGSVGFAAGQAVSVYRISGLVEVRP